MQEIDLLEKLKERDEEAFRIIFNESHKKVINTCFRLVNDIEAAEDITQEVFIKVYTSIDKFRGDSQLSTWIYRIALNTAISFYRNDCKTNDRTLLIDASIISLSNVEETSEFDENISTLYQLIEKLNEFDKALILLYLDNNKYLDIADILGISETNVATKISRIKKILKNQFSNI